MSQRTTWNRPWPSQAQQNMGKQCQKKIQEGEKRRPRGIQEGAKSRPRGYQEEAKGQPKRRPQGNQEEAKSSTRGASEEHKSSPRGGKSRPRGSQEESRGRARGHRREHKMKPQVQAKRSQEEPMLLTLGLELMELMQCQHQLHELQLVLFSYRLPPTSLKGIGFRV